MLSPQINETIRDVQIENAVWKINQFSAVVRTSFMLTENAL